ncbi:MHS family MFS transporter [Rhodococcus wratislaviensis]|nr:MULTISPECIES: MFS transporter [unclassified Rhodococcus (in: high G+C Gram-positive bacteria)]MBC2638170.1 MHS family MFS transporter [Rhodococcus sp. 3A]MBC2897087.1 MHS family MFS transporter [Rhodococcus sp. 4CII]
MSYFRKVVAASMAGTVAEWYEFFLYGMAAALVFGQLFFHSTGNPLDGVIAALLTYAVGFIARPIGGLLFGHFGDKYGRKKLLQVSLLMIGASTFLIGAIPSFDQIGYLAPIALVVLRFIQGIAVGGEWGGAVLLVAEQSPADKRGFWSSFPQLGAPFGNALATIVMLGLSQIMSEEAFLSWGWRIAFFTSAIIVLVGWFIRRSVEDSPIFQNLEEDSHAEGLVDAIKRVFKARPREVLTAMGSRVVENILYYIIVTFSLTYLKLELGLATRTILTLMLAAHLTQSVAILTFGRLSDKWGRRPVYMAGAVLAGGYGFVAFPLMNTGQSALILTALIVGLVIHATMYALQPSMLAEMFPTNMRYVGVSLGNQVATVLAGSLAPVIATWLLREYESWLPIAVYLTIASVISVISVIFMRETKGKSLNAVDAEAGLVNGSIIRPGDDFLAESTTAHIK